jgi:hypothetical protein
VRAERLAQVVRIDQTVRRDRQIRNLYAATLKVAASLQDRRVLDRARDDVAPLPAQFFNHADERHVVGFRAACGEHDLARPGAQQTGHLLPRLLNGLARFSSGLMQAGGVAEGTVEKRPHCLPHAGIDRGRRRVIEVDALGHDHSPR